MRLKWLPWRYVVRRAARKHGFLGPLALMARLSQFGEPSEVAVPIELLRAGAVFHARGLINTSAIQHNLDWVWPFWVERQFDPRDDAFVPRAFSITHVNLTHRNWTAIGLPDTDLYPIIDPRTKGGCMGDGQHMWAAAEWVMAIRNAFVREEDDRLVLASGIPRRWIEAGERMAFGPSPTRWGDVTVAVEPQRENLAVRWEATWRREPPAIECRADGFRADVIGGNAGELVLGADQNV